MICFTVTTHVYSAASCTVSTTMGWLRLVGSLKLQVSWLRLEGSLKLHVSFAEYCLFYRALLQRRPMILRSLQIEFARYWQLTNWWWGSKKPQRRRENNQGQNSSSSRYFVWKLQSFSCQDLMVRDIVFMARDFPDYAYNWITKHIDPEGTGQNLVPSAM